MNMCKTVTDVLGTKFGSEISARVRNRISRADKNGIRGEELRMYLKVVLEEEGMAGGRNSVTPPIIYCPSL